LPSEALSLFWNAPAFGNLQHLPHQPDNEFDASLLNLFQQANAHPISVVQGPKIEMNMAGARKPYTRIELQKIISQLKFSPILMGGIFSPLRSGDLALTWHASWLNRARLVVLQGSSRHAISLPS